ncbi:hypothetical protein PhCBS80983_g01628 [Powellomyces hirtus]|uniref:TLC domain-containing protein n=1 Tax=Powellomyces hirtus TaxID=109895 RepID=A0A507EAA2_9FUNG|nr:hypothetical protein PhCBS80983_g01628 [Powellomyces hirtus]
MLSTTLLPHSYRVAAVTNPEFAFPQLALSWTGLFFISYKCLQHVLDPLSRLSLGILPTGSSRAAIEEWANRCVSTIHAVIAFYGSIDWFVQDRHLIRDPSDYGFIRSHLCEFYMGVTFGYLFFDLLRLLYYKFVAHHNNAVASAPAASMFIHHVVIIIAYYLGVKYHYGTFYMALFLNNELTTPFLNARFLMAERGMKMTRPYALNEVAFVLGFFTSRVVGNIAVLWHMTTHLPFMWPMIESKNVPVPIYFLLPVLAYSHGLLQFYWFALLVRMAYRKLKNGQRQAQSPTLHVPMKHEFPLSRTLINRAEDDDPPIAQNLKVTKILGLPPTGLTGRTLKKLGERGAPNEKAAEVLGLREESPPATRRRRSAVPNR